MSHCGAIERHISDAIAILEQNGLSFGGHNRIVYLGSAALAHEDELTMREGLNW
jgi:hypothetical protein